MKKLLSILVLVLGLASCTKYEQFPVRPVSFEIGGKTYYSAKDTRTVYGNIFNVPDPDSLRIIKREGHLSISYSRTSDFINHDIYGISLELKEVKATFETGQKISFDVRDGLEAYPRVSFAPIKTSDASDHDIYTAVDGWIEFDEIDWQNKTVSGRFEFNAVRQEDTNVCNHDTRIKVKNGSFTNIPLAVSRTPNSNSL